MRRLLVTILMLFALKAAAQENSGDKSESPYFYVTSSSNGADPLPLKSTHADVNITGVMADVIITQEYKNEGTSPLEAIYMFPASSQAAIYAMEMKVGDRKIIARIEEKQKAREQYNQAKAEGKRTSLLEQQRPNLFQMNVANIMPGDVVKVILKYTELLIPEEGTYKFIYPTVVGPRYSGEHLENATASLASIPYTKKGILPTYAFDIDVHLSMGMPIQSIASTTHKISTQYPSTSTAEVALLPEEKNAGNRDFVLDYKLAGNAIESGLMLYEHGDENFFLLMVQPPKRIIKEEIPPREYIFIVDVSGSMHGFPINTTKTLLRNLIVNLKPTDRFNVLLFESGAYWLADKSLPALQENVTKANTFLDQSQGGGGTNLLAAMHKAMTFPRQDEGLSRSYVVVTDGYVNVEKEVFDIIRNKADEANTFAFGIGSGVNRYIIEGMAHVGMSEPFIVLGPEGADKEAERFRKYINNPVLTQVKKTFSGFEAYDVEPVSVPDVLAERPVIIYGKYRGAAKGSITLEGYAGKKKFKKTFQLSEVKPDKKHQALRYLWARKRIQLRDDYKNLGYGSDDQKEVTALGLKYNLMTAYTSFVAIEEKAVNNEKTLTTVKQPLPLPEGVENSAVGFDMEIDGDEVVFSLHKKINLPTDFDNTTKHKIETSIEKNLMPEVNKYLIKNNITLESIEVTVGMDGSVAITSIKGKNLTSEEKDAISKLIKKQLYTKYKIMLVWKYKIEF
ncbi:MAG TPA: VIT domain-containing protein [Cyclobacteriaceae bacterium]|nr:VIT domain-containing protein [Cyclobacteriaceae bacterium]